MSVPVAPPAARQRRQDQVLIVDQTSVAVEALKDALEESGYEAHLCLSPEQALAQTDRLPPDLVLLNTEFLQDATLALVQALRLRLAGRPVPLLLVLAEHGEPQASWREPGLQPLQILRRPIRVGHLLERMAECLRQRPPSAERGSLLDVHGHAAMVLRARDGHRLWQTQLARRLMADYFTDLPETFTPPEVTAWAAREALRQRAGAEPYPLTVSRGGRRLSFALHSLGAGHEGEWLLVLAEAADSSRLQALARVFPSLEGRDVELLLWVGQGASAQILAEWLGAGPDVVSRRLGELCNRLGVATPEQAAHLARNRLAEQGLGLTVSP